jgi:uncharacterized protein YkwD
MGRFVLIAGFTAVALAACSSSSSSSTEVTGDGGPDSTGSSSGGSSSGSSGSSSGSGSGSGSGGDSGASDESEWLTPMNAARAAVGEQPLTWDPIAAAVALSWASGCQWEHNPNASSEYDHMGGHGALGENIAAGAPTQSISSAISSWVAEESSYDHATNSCAAGQVCGHYTQIVWSTTTGVGCAHVSCSKSSPFGSGTWDYSVCDFSPAGNIDGESPY